MGFLDKVTKIASDSLEKGKELASDGLEKGQDLAKTQQLKLEIKKLEGQLAEAHAALGAKAFDHADAGTLSGDAVATETQAVRDARAAVAAKQAEIDAVGDEEGEAEAEPAAAAAASTDESAT